jgi:hypothetical protein
VQSRFGSRARFVASTWLGCSGPRLNRADASVQRSDLAGDRACGFEEGLRWAECHRSPSVEEGRVCRALVRFSRQEASSPSFRGSRCTLTRNVHTTADRKARGFVWVFHNRDESSGGELVLYVFAANRSGETPAQILGGTRGTLVVDGYTGYNNVTDPEGRARGGCWAHLRRKLFEARTEVGDLADEGIGRPRCPTARSLATARSVAMSTPVRG